MTTPTAGTGERISRERDELHQWQAQRLAETSAYVVTRSPFWAERFRRAGLSAADARTPEDLYRCPTLTKQDYIKALEDSPEIYGGLLTAEVRELNQAGALIYRTTGTSGSQGRFINTQEGFDVFGRQGAELLREAGAGTGDFVMFNFPLSLWAAGWGLYYGARQMNCTVIPAGAPVGTTARIQLLKEYRPTVVALTPSYALTLGTALAEAGIEPSAYGVKGLLLGGETFSASKRSRIELLWGIPGGTRDFYGISEGGPLFAVECSAQNGLHLFERDTIHQFWKPDGNEPAAPGELAEHVFTSISQRTMATWFNFRTRDGAAYTDEPCSCGKSSRRMWVKERLDDMVKVRGVNIFASAVEQILSTVPSASAEFLLKVERADERDIVTVEVEPMPGADHETLTHQAGSALKSAIGTRLDVVVVEPGTLPRTELKARRWLDLRPKD